MVSPKTKCRSDAFLDDFTMHCHFAVIKSVLLSPSEDVAIS